MYDNYVKFCDFVRFFIRGRVDLPEGWPGIRRIVHLKGGSLLKPICGQGPIDPKAKCRIFAIGMQLLVWASGRW